MKTAEDYVAEQIASQIELKKTKIKALHFELARTQDDLDRLHIQQTCEHEWVAGMQCLQVSSDDCDKCGASYCY